MHSIIVLVATPRGYTRNCMKNSHCAHLCATPIPTSSRLLYLDQIFKKCAKYTVYIPYPLLLLLFNSSLDMFAADSGQYQSGCPALLGCPADSFRAQSTVFVESQQLQEVSGTSGSELGSPQCPGEQGDGRLSRSAHVHTSPRQCSFLLRGETWFGGMFYITKDTEYDVNVKQKKLKIIITRMSKEKFSTGR